MNAETLNNLKERANEIKTATENGENTAERVGGLLVDMLDYDQSQTAAIDDVATNSRLKQPLTGINQMNSSPSEGQSIRFRNNRWEFFVPGEGGGSSSDGAQSSYFMNVTHGTIPNLPSTSDYVPAPADKFVHGTDEWTSTSPNPGSNEDTWMIWVWFSGGLPLTISGPVLVKDSESSSSNGEDGESIEWAYFLTDTKLDDSDILRIQTDLAGMVSSYNSYYAQPRAIPYGVNSDWTDHPTSIDPAHKYEYTAFRKSSLDANGSRIWGVTGFVGPILWAAYGEKGTDGDGVEYIYYANDLGYVPMGSIYNPNTWDERTEGQDGKTFQDDEFIAEGSPWVDDPVNLENSGLGQGAIEWVSVRKKQTINGITSWQPYCTPRVWSRLAKDGVVDGYTVDLSNQNMPVGTDFDGHASNYTNRCEVTVRHNDIPMNYGTDPGEFSLTIGTITRSDGVAVNGHIQANPALNNPNDIIVSIDSTGIDDFDSKNAFIPITVTIYQAGGNPITRNLILTMYGVAVGEAGKVIDLFTETAAIHTDASGTVVAPTDLDVGVRIGTGESYEIKSVTTAISDGYKFEYFYDDDDTNPSTLQSNSITLAKSKVSISIRLSKLTAPNTYTRIDEERLPYVKDGAKGDNGDSLLSSVPHYHADTSNDENEITPGSEAQTGYWKETIQETGWSAVNKYLWIQEKNTYTWGSDWVGRPSLYMTWIESSPAGADGYSLIVNPPQLMINEIFNETKQTRSYDNANKTVDIQIKDGNIPQPLASSPLTYTSGVTAIGTLDNTGTKLSVKISSITDSSITEGYIQLTVEIDQSPTPFSQLLKIPFYINRLESALFAVEGSLKQYVVNQNYVTQTTYTNGITATEKTLRSDYTEKISKAGNYGRNLFGFNKGILLTPTIYWNTEDWAIESTPVTQPVGTNGKTGRFVVTFKVRKEGDSGNVSFFLGSNSTAPSSVIVDGTTGSNNVALNSSWKDIKLEFTGIPSSNNGIFYIQKYNDASGDIGKTTYLRDFKIHKCASDDLFRQGNWIQGYGLVITHTPFRAANLGFEGEGGTFTVTFQAKYYKPGYTISAVNFVFNMCGILPSLYKVDDGSVTEWSASTSIPLEYTWKTVKLLYEIPNSNSYLSGFDNGYFEIQTASSADLSADTYATIRQLKIERGNTIAITASTFYEADEDIAYMGKGQLITNLSNDQSMTAGSWNIDGSVRKGYSKNIDVPSGQSGYNYGYLYQNGWGNIERGKVYTLSYWAKVDTGVLYIINQFGMFNDQAPDFISLTYSKDLNVLDIYPNDVTSTTQVFESLGDTGYTKIRLTSEWQQFFIRFYAYNDIPSANVEALRIRTADNPNGYTGTVYIADIKLQEGFVMSDTYFNSLIEQNARRITLIQQTGLLKAGIDINNGKITSIGDSFEWVDNEGNQVLGIDTETNEAVFSGTIKAKNFYHEILMWGESTRDDEVWYCKHADGGNGFVVGKYYSANQITTMGGYADPPVDRTEPDDFRACSINADIIVIKNTPYDATSDINVYLPMASDYKGKIVEIIDCRYTQPSGTDYVAPLFVLQADGQQYLKGYFTQNPASWYLQLNGNNEKTGGSSYRLYSDGTYWIVLTVLKPGTIGKIGPAQQ